MEYIRLGKLVDLKQGLAINSHTNHLVCDYETSLALLRIADMPTKKKVVFMDEKTPDRYIAKEDDIIYTRTGQIGLVFTGQKGVVHNNCFRVIPIDEQTLSKKYLFWVLSLPEVYSMANIYAAGAAQPDLPHTSFKKIKIPIFSLPVQNKIASILSSYDNLIELNTRRIKLLEQMAENLYKEWFAYTKIKHSAKIVKIKDIVTIVRGLSYSSDEIDCEEGNNLINLKNINAFGGFRADGTKKYSGKYKQNQIVKCGDLVMGVTDMTQDRRVVGSVALIPEIEGVSVITADLIKLVSNIPNYYLYAMFRFGNISRHIAQFANGANVIHLRPQAVENIKIYLPEQTLIDKYVDFVTPLFSEIAALQSHSANLTRQRDLLLPRLMSGQLTPLSNL